MRRIPSVGLVALLGTGACYSYAEPPMAAPQWNPAFVSGPPGGAIDPDYSAQEPIYGAEPVDPGGSPPAYADGAAGEPGSPGAAPGSVPEQGEPAPSTDPAD